MYICIYVYIINNYYDCLFSSDYSMLKTYYLFIIHLIYLLYIESIDSKPLNMMIIHPLSLT